MRFVVRKVKIAGKSTGTELEPPRPANSVLKAVEEYEAKESLEVICAISADKLECLIQAVEYRDLGVQRVQSWIDSSRAAFKTETAKRVADVALEISPLSWREK
jgi:putative hydrolase of HD superfamily